MRDQTGKRFAVLVSRFPTVSETFIVRELTELERNGLGFELFALVRPRNPFVPDDAADLAAACHYAPVWAPSTIADQFRWLVRSPGRYLRVWWRVLRQNLRTPKFLLRALAVVPMAASFAHTVQKGGIERVHAHWVTHPALAAWVIRELTGVPYSLTAHAHDLYEHHSMLGRKVADADAIVVCSEHNRELLAHRFGDAVADKTTVVRHGVDLDVFSSEPVVASATGPELRILCIASFVPFKGHRYLLEACRVLQDEGVPFSCTLVGDGAERSRLIDLVSELGLEQRVRMTGAVPGAEVRRQLSGCDVVVQPSIELDSGRKDGVPNVLVEALAMKRPVVASALPGISELVEDGQNGLLVPQRDPRALADALARLARDPALRRHLATAGHERVVQEYDTRRNGAALYELLTALPTRHPTQLSVDGVRSGGES